MPPRPTSTEELAARGSRHVNTARRQNGADSPATVPETPPSITGTPELAGLWDDAVDRLEAVGTLSHVDANAIERYVHLTFRFNRATAVLNSFGSNLETRDAQGNLTASRPRPEVAEANSCAASCLKLEMELGLLPAARVALPSSRDKGLGLSDADRELLELIS